MFDYHGNLSWLPSRIIYLSRHGSHAYGTNGPRSDLDLRGVAIPPREYLLGYLRRFEQAEQKGDPDVVIFALSKFMALAADCNPNVLEILYTDPSDHLGCTPLGERLLAARGLFLSRKARHTFSGYAVAQLKRIETHRRWLLHPPARAPERADFGLPPRTVLPKDQLAAAESMMRKRVESWQMDLTPLDEASKIQFNARLAEVLGEMGLSGAAEQMHAAGRQLGFSENFLELLDRERHYNTAQREWEQYQSWIKTRNPDRAALEARHGYDCKHGMHLVRLLRMCREILTRGEVIVRRPDAEELRAIRNGAWSYDQLVTWARGEDEALEALYRGSPLPREPDRAAIDRLCVELTEAALGM
jgi:hypothetical protein